MAVDLWSFLSSNSSEVIAGLAGGAISTVLTGTAKYVSGWYRAGRFQGEDFHIAATMYTPIDIADPSHAQFAEAVSAGKTHVQELIWLGEEVALGELLTNPYILREVSQGMARTRGPGLLLGQISKRAERPLLKKILGYHNKIPTTDLVRFYKRHVGTAPDGRVHGIAPPTHEHYKRSAHRRVLRAIFIAESQLKNGLPPKDKVHFVNEGHADRYETLTTLIAAHRKDPVQFDACRAYF